MNLKELVAGPSRMGADTELSTGGMAFDHTPGAFDTDYFKELRPADGGFSYLTQNTAERHKGDASQSYTSNETSKFLPFRSCRKVYAEYGGGPNLDDREFTCRSTCGCFPLKGTVQGGFTCNDGSAIDASIKGCGSAQCQSAAKSAGKCAGSTCSDAELDDWAKAKHDNKLPEGHPPVSLESGICPMAAGQATRLIAGHTIEETRAKIEAGASKLAANPSAYKTPVRCKRLCTDELKYCTHVPATITDAVGPKVSVKSMKTLTKWNGVHMRLGRLAADFALYADPVTKQIVDSFIADESLFAASFSGVMQKLVDQGHAVNSLQTCTQERCTMTSDGLQCGEVKLVLDAVKCNVPKGSTCSVVGAIGARAKVNCGGRSFVCCTNAGGCTGEVPAAQGISG